MSLLQVFRLTFVQTSHPLPWHRSPYFVLLVWYHRPLFWIRLSAFSLQGFLQPPITSSFVGPALLLGTLYCSIHTVLFSQNDKQYYIHTETHIWLRFCAILISGILGKRWADETEDLKCSKVLWTSQWTYLCGLLTTLAKSELCRNCERLVTSYNSALDSVQNK
jgi:hypothetical protein